MVEEACQLQWKLCLIYLSVILANYSEISAIYENSYNKLSGPDASCDCDDDHKLTMKCNNS